MVNVQQMIPKSEISFFYSKYMLEKTEWPIKNRQCRDTGTIENRMADQEYTMQRHRQHWKLNGRSRIDNAEDTGNIENWMAD